jgi:hypothetical protein
MRGQNVVSWIDPDQSLFDQALNRAVRRIPRLQGVSPMLDIVMLAIGFGFFALSVGYAIACDRL